MDMTWSERIKGLEESGKSLTEIGRLIGKSPQAVSDIKQGRTREPGGMAAVRLHHLYLSVVGSKKAGEVDPDAERIVPVEVA
ncbi:XRE family transcriptional regulator [Xanthomonas campestris]|uniref:helix-turn-helix domain-containing protein n=1 Tax=Xanthomonas campestris TaxID=339 RepID=UPI002B2360DB|nr:XRE family transcriptional regulator [Xanthomonas campestris]MEB1653831.1 XRE family transcriptional regulator [Xanthomonas campestris pv. campestris]MEA9551711.1 XRE family transcriptional regulator [Xanthomonas campestris]MEB1863586.1 XRE family transcriptional regulator [Xanthomonas campestris pv. campestris]MEB1892161.1 XRE family transcriptional regulator [Xanthomonas campestris pv. campestris]MEB2012565.1 XRE family transcriptional regulator [Xanthomonas campestris pv. campestris]